MTREEYKRTIDAIRFTYTIRPTYVMAARDNDNMIKASRLELGEKLYRHFMDYNFRQYLKRERGIE